MFYPYRHHYFELKITDTRCIHLNERKQQQMEIEIKQNLNYKDDNDSVLSVQRFT